MTNAQSTIVADDNDIDDTSIEADAVEEKPQSSRTALVLDIISFLSRFGLAATWIWAGFHKVGSVLETGQSIQAYKIFTLEWSVFLAQIIGPLELIGVFFRQAGWLSTIVLMLFIIGIGQAWARGLVIDCGCFGKQDLTDGGMDYLQTILRDVVLIAMSLWTAYRPYRRFAIYP